MSDVDELRAAVAAERGLPARAVRFLNATNLEELERQAGQLAELLGASRGREQEPEQHEPEPLNIFANIGAAKAARNRAIVEAIHGPRPQPRDDQGRFTSTGWDGGARELSMPTRQSPEEAHDELIVTLSRFSRAYGGGAGQF